MVGKTLQKYAQYMVVHRPITVRSMNAMKSSTEPSSTEVVETNTASMRPRISYFHE